jgi:hypothetical protein
MKRKFFRKFWFPPFILGICFGLASCHKGINPAPGAPPITASSNWTRISALPNEKIAALEVANNIVYAASASGIVYQSADNGTTWSASTAVSVEAEITSLAIFNNKIFVGTYNNGIYASVMSI